jgi:lipopolysaccharide transport system permease protein
LGLLALSLARNQQLLLRLAGRELSARFRGSVLGLAWTVLTPLLLAAVYTFVFTSVFKMRWAGADESSVANFATYLMVGLALQGILVECLARAPGLMRANPSYVTKVVFPLEILPFVPLLPAIVTACVSLLAAIVINLYLTGHLYGTILFIPLFLAPFVLYVAALTMIISAFGVYLRDLAQIVNIIIPLTLFLSPVFYPLEAVPARIQPLLVINPLTFAIEQLRLVIIKGGFPDWAGLALYTVIAIICVSLAHRIFASMRKGFSDVV